MTALLKIVQLVWEENGFCDQMASLPHVELQLDLFLIDFYALPLHQVVLKNQKHLLRTLLLSSRIGAQECDDHEDNNEYNPWSGLVHLGKNFGDSEMCEAMDTAIQQNNTELLQVLMDGGPRTALLYRTARFNQPKHSTDVTLFRPFDRAAHHGRQTMLQWFYDYNRVYCTHSALVEAAAGGWLEMVEFLVTKGLAQQADQAVVAAAENGHLEVVQRLLQQCAFKTCNMTWLVTKALTKTLRSGHLRLAAWLEDWERQKNPSIQRFALIHQSLPLLMTLADVRKRLVSTERPLRELQWLLEEYHWTRSVRRELVHQLLVLACETGDLLKVRYLVERLHSPSKWRWAWWPEKLRPGHRTDDVLAQAMKSACTHGHLPVVEFLALQGVPIGFLKVAMVNGHVQLAQYLAREFSLVDRKTGSTTRLIPCQKVVARQCHTTISNTHHKGDNDQPLCYPATSVHTAASSGNVDLLQFLFKSTPYELQVYLEAMQCGLQAGHLQVVGLVLSWWSAKQQESDIKTSKRMTNAMVGLLHNVLRHMESWTWDRLEGIFAVLSQCLPSTRRLTGWVVPTAIREAVVHKHVRLIQQFHIRQVQGFSMGTMDLAARVGSLSIVRFLHENRDEGCSTNAMDSAAAGGFLHIIQYLQANRHEGCTSQAISLAIDKGHWQVVQCLLLAKR